MKTFLSGVLVLMLTTLANARLGESPSNIEARYGKPWNTPNIMGTNEYSLDYNNAGYRVHVIFWNGKSAEEGLSSDTEIDRATAKKLFRNISGKDPVKENSKSVLEGQTMTFYGADGVEGNLMQADKLNWLTVTDSAYAKHRKEVEEADKKKKLDSF
jgi:hypothetical protein